VAQLAGYCAEHTAYHHGEASMQATIVGMAQVTDSWRLRCYAHGWLVEHLFLTELKSTLNDTFFRNLFCSFVSLSLYLQDFVGANNVPLLAASGQFGTRLEGGKDAASAR